MIRTRYLLSSVAAVAFIAALVFPLFINQTGPAASPTPDVERPLTDDSTEVKVSLPAFHRLDGNYLRGGQPARGGILALRRLGVRAVIDLRSRYDHTQEIGVAAERYGLRYHWMPMSVWEPPAEAQVKEFLTVAADPARGPVYVFCTDGLHRTGMMSAIYRAAHNGWSVKQALEEMDRVGFNPFYSNLRTFVWAYARKHHPESLPAGARRLSVFDKQLLGGQ